MSAFMRMKAILGKARVPFSFERGTIRNWYNSVKHRMENKFPKVS
ncbi:hypothetical protein [Providencia rettgeri]